MPCFTLSVCKLKSLFSINNYSTMWIVRLWTWEFAKGNVGSSHRWFLLERKRENINITILTFHSDVTSIKCIASRCLFANWEVYFLQITFQLSWCSAMWIVRLWTWEFVKGYAGSPHWWFLLGRKKKNINITIVLFHSDNTSIKCILSHCLFANWEVYFVKWLFNQVDYAPLIAGSRQR